LEKEEITGLTQSLADVIALNLDKAESFLIESIK